MQSILKVMTVLFLLLASSCKKEIIYEGPAGDLIGKALLFNGSAQSAESSEIEVVIEGSEPEMRTKTDSNGNFMFSGLKTGIYNLCFSKPDYAEHKMVSYQHIGGAPTYLYPVKLYKLPDYSVTSLKIDTGRYSQYFGFVRVTLTLSSYPSAYNAVRMYISDKPSVSYLDYSITLTHAYTVFDLTLNRLPKGKQLYMICYPSATENEGYIDMLTGNTIYYVKADGASEINGFVIPNTL